MEKIEKRVANKRRKENIQEAILRSIFAAGMLSVVLVAPNMLKYLGNPEKFLNDRNSKYRMKNTLWLLAKKRLIRFEKNSRGTFARLTDKGERALGVMIARAPDKRRSKKWDGRWRLVIYDIPEYSRVLRKKLQRTLRAFGFERLQDSIWIYPFDCEALIALLKADLHIGRNVLYVIAEEIEDDHSLRKLFGLSSR